MRQALTGAEALRRALSAQMTERWGPEIASALQERQKGDDEALIRAYQAALGIAVEQEVRAHRDRDQVTIMKCAFGCSAAKTITAAGIKPYACGMWFTTTEGEVTGLARLAGLLEQIQRQARIFTIRGEPIEGHDPGRVRKKCHPDPADPAAPYFRAKARRHLAIDLDSFSLPAGVAPLDARAVGEAGRALLPAELRSAGCWAQLTSSAGYAPGGRCRLWFWCSRPVSDAEVKRWLKGYPVGTSLYNPVQPHYVARPTFTDGIADPAPIRSIILPGEVDVVAVPDLTEPAAAPKPVRQCRTFGSFGSAYPRGVLESARGSERYLALVIAGVRQAPHGQGREALMSAAMRLYGAVKAGRVDPIRATALLKQAMIDRGWSADESARGMTLADVGRQLDWCWTHSEPRG